MAKPIPAPRKKPPKVATSKLSLVTFGKDTFAKTIESPIIAIVVFKANCFPIILYPKIIKGTFTQIIRMYNGISVNAEISKDTPVAPPSIK